MLLKQKSPDRRNLFIILSITGFIYLTHAIYFPGSFQGGDGLRHYLISRYSWRHPDLFLNLWGKPFFTICSSAFSQFGLLGIKIFNIFCAIFSSIVIFQIAKRINIQRPLIAPVFLCFASIYFFMINSGYTEPFFGLMLVTCTLLYIKSEYIWSTILISFLPLVRSEGYLILPLFFMVLILRRRYLNVLLLSVGNLVYSIIGYFVFKDFFWIRTQNPYDGHMDLIYGHGKWYHFFASYDEIWGTPLAILTLIGLVSAAIHFFKKQFVGQKYYKEEIILIFGSLFVYFIAHSIFWWKGIFNSLGLIRVIGAVLPFSALIALQGFNFLLSFFSKNKLLTNLITVFVLVSVIINPVLKNYFPLKLDPEEQLVVNVKNWYENSEFKDDRFRKYYLQPYIPEALSFDAFDKKNGGEELWSLYPAINTWGYDAIPDSSLVFWDAHYGPNEAAIPLEKLLKDRNFRFIKAFIPEQSFNVLGNYSFEIDVFQKIHPVKNSLKPSRQDFYDFETDENLENIKFISNDIALSGVKSCRFDSLVEYGVTITKKRVQLLNPQNINCIRLTLNVNSKSKFISTAVLSFHKGETQQAWYSFDLEQEFKPIPEWKTLTGIWKIDPKLLMNSDYIKIYLWNNRKLNFYADDFKVDYLDSCKTK